jgi:hypothetical protein
LKPTDFEKPSISVGGALISAKFEVEEYEKPLEKQSFLLTHENELWNVYAGENLEATFESYKEAESYMRDEGFSSL